MTSFKHKLRSFKHNWIEICILSLFSIFFVYLFLKHTKVIEGNEQKPEGWTPFDSDLHELITGMRPSFE